MLVYFSVRCKTFRVGTEPRRVALVAPAYRMNDRVEMTGKIRELLADKANTFAMLFKN
jgi:hypothetical protein